MPSTLLGKMSEALLLPKPELAFLIKTAPYRYKVYEVPKRSGSGRRTIAQPAKEVKRLQYWVMKNIFPLFPVHKSATAYVAKKNIRNNSQPHAANPYLLKLDFKDFFPSIRGQDFVKYAQTNENLEFMEDDLIRLEKILFWCPRREQKSELQLSIGAPSSPQLSNAIMYQFDSEIAEFCSLHEINYTRYADDMTFSMLDKMMRGTTRQKVIEVLGWLPFPQLQINERKTVYGSKAHRRMVTGLILANEGRISLGREKKRRIRARIHHFVNGRLSEEEKQSLRGLIAFARSIEPTFVQRMEEKYGSNVIKEI